MMPSDSGKIAANMIVTMNLQHRRRSQAPNVMANL